MGYMRKIALNIPKDILKVYTITLIFTSYRLIASSL